MSVLHRTTLPGPTVRSPSPGRDADIQREVCDEASRLPEKLVNVTS
ncbi:hypothetical protein Save01_02988 [Streptomyces avermitilis]